MPANNLNWMLWFEEDPKATPQASLDAAVAYFKSKYGCAPNRLQAPLAWPENVPTEGLQVERKHYVQPRYLHLAFDPTLAAVQEQPPQGD